MSVEPVCQSNYWDQNKLMVLLVRTLLLKQLQFLVTLNGLVLMELSNPNQARHITVPIVIFLLLLGSLRLSAVVTMEAREFVHIKGIGASMQ